MMDYLLVLTITLLGLRSLQTGEDPILKAARWLVATRAFFICAGIGLKTGARIAVQRFNEEFEKSRWKI